MLKTLVASFYHLSPDKSLCFIHDQKISTGMPISLRTRHQSMSCKLGIAISMWTYFSFRGVLLAYITLSIVYNQDSPFSTNNCVFPSVTKIDYVYIYESFGCDTVTLQHPLSNCVFLGL